MDPRQKRVLRPDVGYTPEEFEKVRHVTRLTLPTWRRLIMQRYSKIMSTSERKQFQRGNMPTEKLSKVLHARMSSEERDSLMLDSMKPYMLDGRLRVQQLPDEYVALLLIFAHDHGAETTPEVCYEELLLEFPAALAREIVDYAAERKVFDTPVISEAAGNRGSPNWRAVQVHPVAADGIGRFMDALSRGFLEKYVLRLSPTDRARVQRPIDSTTLLNLFQRALPEDVFAAHVNITTLKCVREGVLHASDLPADGLAALLYYCAQLSGADLDAVGPDGETKVHLLTNEKARRYLEAQMPPFIAQQVLDALPRDQEE